MQHGRGWADSRVSMVRGGGGLAPLEMGKKMHLKLLSTQGTGAALLRAGVKLTLLPECQSEIIQLHPDLTFCIICYVFLA